MNNPYMILRVLTNNEFQGEIPIDDICVKFPKLTYLSLAENLFTGPVKMTSGNCEKLTNLYIYQNNLAGTLDELKLPSSLKVFNAEKTLISGGLSFLEGLSNLEVLALGDNFLFGDLDVLSSLTKLQLLQLQNNAFQGELPLEITNLEDLYRMYVHFLVFGV